MLLAYIDEIGETGAFKSRADPRFNTSPAFGYSGFVLPERSARLFGQAFQEEKRKLFAREIESSDNPSQWERKGSDIFRPSNLELFPQHLRVFKSLVARLRSFGGNLFYYADEKQIGTPRQTRLDQAARETEAMRETLNRLARHANEHDDNLLVMMDQVNEKQRIARMPKMYAHMFSRSGQFAEMKRIVEPPMHLDSAVSANIQFADWVAACVSRAIDYQLIEDSLHAWITGPTANAVHGSFTHESKLHLYHRSVDDFHHSEIFYIERRLFPQAQGVRIANAVGPQALEKIKAVAERSRHPNRRQK